MHTIEDIEIYYYTGVERRLAHHPRRHTQDRRHRLRNEALISEFRQDDIGRRIEDEQGFFEIDDLYYDQNS